MSSLKLYNSLNRNKEEFVPIDRNHVRIYACGPTVYNYAHIGNARMAVVFDLLARLLRQQFPQVTYASDITAIERIVNEWMAKRTSTAITAHLIGIGWDDNDFWSINFHSIIPGHGHISDIKSLLSFYL